MPGNQRTFCSHPLSQTTNEPLWPQVKIIITKALEANVVSGIAKLVDFFVLDITILIK